jgi:hypothetical protein
MRKPITLALGTSSRSNSNRFAPRVLVTKVTPVTLPPGTVETRNEAEIDRVSADRENDWNGCGCSFGSHSRRRSKRNDHGRWVRHQIGSYCWQPVEARIGRAIFDCEIAPLDVASVLKALTDGADLSISS